MSGKDFTGKVAFVTGAGNGIGRATAVAFAKAGANVALADIDILGCQDAAKEIQQDGGKCLSIGCDVTKETDIRDALDETLKTFGSLDIAFNNAGAYQKIAPLADFGEEDWHRIMDVNVTSTFLCMRNQIPIMLERGGGCIVNTSSGAGVIANKGGAIYGAAKHAVLGLTRSAALDYATKNIRINAVCPGVVISNLTRTISGDTLEGLAALAAMEPIGRLGQPEEIASAVLWLCSKDAGFTIGHGLVVDGGYTIG